MGKGVTQDKARKFREELVRNLALTEFARNWAMLGPRDHVPPMLGVTPDVLDDAADLIRTANFGRTTRRREPAKPVFTFLPRVMARPFIAMAHQLAMTHTQLLRSLIHAAMLVAREPNTRPGKDWGPLPGCEHFRSRLNAIHQELHLREGPQPHKNSRHNIQVLVSPGLYDAVRKRAAAFGVSTLKYIMCWVADLIDGQLSDLVISGVEVGQTYDDAPAYVLPVLPSTET